MFSSRSYLACLLVSISSFWTFPASAQIVPDQTLGTESSIFSSEIEIRGELADLVEGGAIRGNNLFHSFSDFNIDELQRVYFANPADVTSILSRVTGNHTSNIFGTLGVNGNADLFLLNPNGIIFGPDASLDIEGSFYATTAEAVELGNGVFNAADPEQSQLLAVRPSVSFFNHLTPQSGDITNRGQIIAGGDLVLAGRNLDIEAQIGTVGDISLLAADGIRMRDTAENPLILLTGGDLLIQGNQQINIVALSHPDSELFSYGDMVLRSAENIGGDAHYWAGQSFRVEQLDGQPNTLHSPQDPIIRALGDVRFNLYIGTSLHILAGGSVDVSGGILITGPEAGTEGNDFLRQEVSLSEGTTVNIDGQARRTLDIRAGVRSDAIGIPGPPSGINFLTDLFLGGLTIGDPPVNRQADITLGSVLFVDFTDFDSLFEIINNINNSQDIINRLAAGDILLTNQYEPAPNIEGDIILSSTIADVLDSFNLMLDPEEPIPDITLQSGGTDASGRIFIDSRNDIELNGLINSSNTPLTGEFLTDGGDITLLAQNDINLTSGTAIVSAGLASGQLRFVSNGTFTIDDSAIASLSTGRNSRGEDITINANDILLTQSSGAGSRVLEDLANLIDNDDLVFFLDEFDSSGIVAISLIGSQSGDIEITSETLQIENNSPTNDPMGANQVGIATFSFGDGGALTVNAQSITIVGNSPSDQVLLPNRELASNVRDIPTGLTTATVGPSPAGDLTLNVQQLTLRNGAGISSGSVSEADNAGDGGQLIINNAEIIDLEGFTAIATGTLGAGNAGDLIINNAGTIILNDGALIAADSVGSGDAGNVILDGETLQVNDGSRISAATDNNGAGGDIDLTFSERIELLGRSPIFMVNNEPVQVPSGIFTNSQGMETSAGIAGTIDITTPTLTLNDGEISTSAEQASGGTILIRADNILLTGDSDILTFVDSGINDGGNITIAGDTLVALDDSDILAFAADGNGGNVDLSQTNFFGQNFEFAPPGTNPRTLDNNDRVDINAEGRSSSGAISLNDISFIDNNFIELPDNLKESTEFVATSCIARSEDTTDRFALTSGNNLPQQPDSPEFNYSLGTVQLIPEAEDTARASTPAIIEPQMIYPLADGRLVMSRDCGE